MQADDINKTTSRGEQPCRSSSRGPCPQSSSPAVLPIWCSGNHMADQKSLRFIGFGFAVITAAVTLVAAMVVTDAAQNVAAPDRPQIVAVNASV
jgi:hypothetical protein